MQLLARWVAFVARQAWPMLAGLALLTAVFGWLAVDRFRINSNLTELIAQEAPWRVDFDRYEAAFPDAVRTSAVVVSGTSYKGVEDAARSLEAQLRAADDFFRAIYAPQNEPFFRQHALLFLELDALDDMADRLASAQPVLTAVAEDPSLRGIFELVTDGLENDGGAAFDTLVQLLADSGERLLAGGSPAVAWTDELFASDGTQYRVIFLKGRVDFGETLPSAEIMSRLRQMIADTELGPGVEVRITGEIPLQHEEIEAAVAGVQLAGWLALALLAAIMILGVRSLKIVAGTFLMLLVGIVWTSAYAMFAVGEYNTLSIIFLVMFFGLGVDFAVHFSLRYQEAMNAGAEDCGAALTVAARSVGGAIATCTATTSIGFLGFLPTDYRGLADLGVISAGGMVVAAVLTFTLLPAFYAAVGPIRAQATHLPTGDGFVRWLQHRRRVVLVFVAALAVLAGGVAARIHFDYSVLALKDEGSESMRTLRELQAQGVATDYSLIVLDADPARHAQLASLDLVDSVTTPAGYVPADQEDKQFVLADLQELLWSALVPARTRAPPTPAELAAEAALLGRAIQAHGAGRPELQRLRRVLAELPAEGLTAWEHGVVSNLREELAWLREALAVDRIVFADLPMSLRARLVSDDGHQVTTITPAGDMSNVAALTEFVETVRAHVPLATGRSVIEWGVGQIVVGSFQAALLYATTGIVLVLLLVFRNLRDTVMILVPLVLTAVVTLAVGVLVDIPLNMANILVLPLIFGLGVDNGIHVVHRFRHGGDVGRLMRSSTPRAVMLSTLTSIGAFAALSVSPHQGTASVGVLLALAVALLLVFTVFLLPVLLSATARRSSPA